RRQAPAGQRWHDQSRLTCRPDRGGLAVSQSAALGGAFDQPGPGAWLARQRHLCHRCLPGRVAGLRYSPRRFLMLIFQPLGDQAVLVRCPGESEAFRFSTTVRAAGPAWLVDVVQAYTTVAVFFSPDEVAFEQVSTFLSQLEQNESTAIEGKLHEVPCCYEMQ